MLNPTDFSAFQACHSDFNKNPSDFQDYYDKENCNVHQPKPSERLPFQVKSSTMNPLSERMNDNSTQSTKDSSPEYDQSSRLNDMFHALNNANQRYTKECQHVNTVTWRCSYCKDCGVFLPMNGSVVYREQMYQEKLTANHDEVYEIMLMNQTKNRFYHPNAPHIEIRKTITDWIFQVSQDLKISPDTTCAIIAYVDTILCKTEVSKENLQLVILTCLILATKFSETDDKVPPFREAYNLCQGAYSIELFKKAENFVLEQLDWNLRVISPYQYIHLYLSRGCLFSSDQAAFSQVNADILRYLRRYSECFANLSMDSYEFNQFLSHVVACAAIASTRKLIGVSPVWNEELEELTGTAWEVIEPCFNQLYSCFENSFPELLDLSKTLSEKNESQSDNNEIQIESSTMQIEELESKESPIRTENNKIFPEDAESGKKEELPMIQKKLKRKSSTRLSKANKENKSKKNENNSMNIESSNEFFENSDNSGHIKRNLIY